MLMTEKSEAEEEALQEVQRDWEEQCQKLEQAGYSTDEISSPSGMDKMLLTQQYLADKETGREFLNDLVLGLCSGSMNMLTDTRSEMRGAFLEARDARFKEATWHARKTYALNYEAVEDMARSPLTDEMPLYKWMAVSKSFPSDNRLSKDEGESGKIGPAPSLKTLWKMSAGIGLHPILFLTDDNVREAARSLAEHDQNPQEVDKAAETIDRAAKAWERLEKAEHDGQKVDHREHWLDIIEGYAKDIGCGSPGGILGARLAIEVEDPSVLTAMTRFGHLLGETVSEGLASTNLFTTSSRKGPFSPDRKD